MNRDKQVNTRITTEQYGRLEQACKEVNETKSTFLCTSVDERIVRLVKRLHKADAHKVKRK